jgi:hypothetical protein
MRNCLLLISAVLSIGSGAQTPVVADSVVCRVMEFLDQDSLQTKEQATLVYNNRGQLISETYFRFQETCLFYHVGYSVRYTYKDTLLVEKVLSVKQRNPSKYTYTHDEKGRVKTESKFVWVPDPGAVPGHRPGMPAENTTVSGKWNQVSYATITYDAKGRKISWDATRLHDGNENLEKWEYDDQNRVTTHQIYAHGKLAHKTDYTYYDGGYRYWEINYTSEGDLASDREQGDGYKSMIIHAVTLDKNGKIRTEELTSEKGDKQCSKTFYYDKDGRFMKTVTYDYLSGALITYVYKRAK